MGKLHLNVQREDCQARVSLHFDLCE